MGNPRYANGYRRRQLRARVLAEETHCALCHAPVDQTLPARHPLSAEVDEILPLSLGGDPLLRSNVQLTHRSCNQRKSNRHPTHPGQAAGTTGDSSNAAHVTGNGIPTSQQW